MREIWAVVNGTFYPAGTPYEVIRVLEQCRADRTRIVIDYGDPRTGKSWGEHPDRAGYVDRSTGTQKIPLLVYNRRAMGGGGILTTNILSIKTSDGKRTLYSLAEQDREVQRSMVQRTLENP